MFLLNICILHYYNTVVNIQHTRSNFVANWYVYFNCFTHSGYLKHQESIKFHICLPLYSLLIQLNNLCLKYTIGISYLISNAHSAFLSHKYTSWYILSCLCLVGVGQDGNQVVDQLLLMICIIPKMLLLQLFHKLNHFILKWCTYTKLLKSLIIELI